MGDDNDSATEKPIHLEESYPKLISLAVHELRTPASVVAGYLRMLQRDADPLTERQRKMIDEAARSCARIVDLIGELSEVSKLDSGTAPLERRTFDFFTLVQEVAEGVHEAGDRDVRFEVRGPAAGALMTGDQRRVRAAIDAIFRAILREQPPGRTVVAERRLVRNAAGAEAALVVADDGSVQTAYDARRAAFDEKRGGLGLALPIARRVVEAHGGRLWSPAPDSGREETVGKGAAVLAFPIGLKL
jgi:signal transduction histidine kinase